MIDKLRPFLIWSFILSIFAIFPSAAAYAEDGNEQHVLVLHPFNARSYVSNLENYYIPI